MKREEQKLLRRKERKELKMKLLEKRLSNAKINLDEFSK